MKYLNLTKGFNPFNSDKSNEIQFESFFFNGGEPHIKLDISKFESREDIIVTSRLTSMNDLGILMVASEALFQSDCFRIVNLFIPYFPGARQDRRMIKGEPLTVKIFAEIINEMNYDLVTTFDNHSEVSTALINNCENLDNHHFILKCLDEIEFKSDFYLVSPDSGANKKIKDLGIYLYESYQFNIIKCDKTRNVSDGKITGFEVYKEDLKGKDCVIVDDICDGGATFIGLAQELKKKNCGDLYLIVSHGIFSKGFYKLLEYFKKIYTTDSWYNGESNEVIKIIKFNEFIS